MFRTTFSGSSPSLSPAASMMRRLAWCGTNQSTSSRLTDARANVASMDWTSVRTANSKIARPCMCNVVSRCATDSWVDGWRLPPARMPTRSVSAPSQPRSDARRPLSTSASRVTTTAPAPSPKMTEVARSSGSRTREKVSAPMSSALLNGPELSSAPVITKP